MCLKLDCDSFLQKSKSLKYVKYENGHEYCFECLNPPHDNKPCEKYFKKKFMNWKNLKE